MVTESAAGQHETCSWGFSLQLHWRHPDEGFVLYGFSGIDAMEKDRNKERFDPTVETIEAVTLGGSGEVAALFSVTPRQPKALSAVVFDGTESWCSNSDEIVEFAWDFGDGTDNTTHDSIVNHNFPRAGQFVVRLRVRTRDGMEAEIRKSVRVGFRLDLEHEPPCPLAASLVTFTARAFVNLHAEDKIMTYAWDLNDDGSFDRTTNDGELNHIFAKSGVYLIKVRAVNVNGIQEEASHTVEVHDLTGSL